MLVNGDKLVVKKRIMGILDVGDIAEVINVNNEGMVYFAFGENFSHKGLMNASECEEHFEKIEMNFGEPAIREERINALLDEAEFEINVLFDKCIVVSCELQSGFVITEYYDFLVPEDYDEDLGFDICFSKIKEKLWEFEKYRVMDEVFEESLIYEEEEDELDEYLENEFFNSDSDCDCDKCNDFNCMHHPSNS